MKRFTAILAVCMIGSAGAATASASADLPAPGRPGQYPTQRVEGFGGWESVDVGLEYRVEDLAEVTYPSRPGGAVARGRFPVVLLLHGRHQWCSDVGDIPAPDPTPQWCSGFGTIPVPSYTGYRYLADRIASQGRVVISISANGINSQDGSEDYGATARGKLVEHHLAALATGNRRATALYGSRFTGHLDLSRTVLMGHSRGGEGVVRAAQMIADRSKEPYRLAGVVPFAPVAFSRSAPAIVPTVTLLPACDGDVSDQQGQTLVDRARDLYRGRGALQSSVWIGGANHNYLNTEWTPGMSASDTGSDDAGYAYGPDPSSGRCQDSLRLTPAEERVVGREYLAAVVRYTQDGNRSMLRLLDGSGPRPRAVAADGTAARSASITGPDRLLLVPKSASRTITRGVSASLCAGDSFADDIATPDACGRGVVGSYSGNDTAWLGPTFRYVSDLPGRTALRMEWSDVGRAFLALPRARDLSAIERLSARVVLDPTSTGSVRLAIRDSKGRVAVARAVGSQVSPITGTASDLRLWPQQIWAPRKAFRGVDLSRIEAVGLATSGQGRAWLVDVSSRGVDRAPRASVLPTANLPDLQQSIVPGQTTSVPYTVRLDRPALNGARIRVWLDQSGSIPEVNETAVVPPGGKAATIRIPVTTPGDFASDTSYPWIYTESGATVGRWNAQFTVVSSGLTPTSTPRIVNRDPTAVAEPGGRLVWRFKSRNAVDPIRVEVRSVSASLDYADLDPAFRMRYGLPDSGRIDPSAPLTLVSHAAGGGDYEISLPLSAAATEGTSIDFALTGIDGARGVGRASLSGFVAER